MSKVFKMVTSKINQISITHNINKNVSTILQKPNNIIQTNFPVKIKGEIKMFQGYRVQHNNICGPYKALTLRQETGPATLLVTRTGTK